MHDWRPRMRKAVQHLAEQLKGIRPDTLSVGFVETFRVSVRGNSTPMRHLAAVKSQEGRIIITPFDPTVVGAIVKSLTDAKLNAYAMNPTTVCVAVPPVSGEQKAEFARHVKKLGEEAKVAVRAVRQDARKEIAATGRGSERKVQETTDEAVTEIEQLVNAKVKSLLT